MKLANFPERLGVFINEHSLMPYAWGTNDCVTFAANAVWAITGKDPIESIRGTWTDAVSAAVRLEEQGGLVVAVDALFERRSMVTFAQRGDIVLVKDMYQQPSLAICTGEFAAAPGIEEMLLMPMNEWRIAWEVK